MQRSIWLVATVAAVGLAATGWAQPGGSNAKPAPAAAVVPGSKYGALAVDRAKGFAFGFAYDQASRAEAVDRANRECAQRGGNCTTVVEFAGPGCAAYRTISASDGSAYGWGVGDTREAAESRAADECTKFSGGRACSNQVWSCNSGDGRFAALKADPVRRPPAPGDCLVQYELQVYRGNDWASRFYSPVYRFSATDCPLSANSVYHSFGYSEQPGGKPNIWESNEERKNPAKQQVGFDWAKTFFAWTAARPSPFPGHRIHTAASLKVADATPANLADLVKNVARQDAGDSIGVTVGHCIGYAPPGAIPVEVVGGDKCRRWYR